MPQTGEDFYAKDSWTLKRKRLHSSASHITQKRFEKPHTCAACDHYSPWGFLLKCQLPIQVKLCHRGSCRNWRGSAVHRASTHVWPMRWCCRTVWPVHSWIVTMYPGKRCSCHSYWSESITPAETVMKWKHATYLIMLGGENANRQTANS